MQLVPPSWRDPIKGDWEKLDKILQVRLFQSRVHFVDKAIGNNQEKDRIASVLSSFRSRRSIFFCVVR